MKKASGWFVVFFLFFASSLEAQNCPEIASGKPLGGTLNAACSCPKGFAQGTVQQAFQIRNFSPLVACRQAKKKIKKDCKKKGRLVHFSAKIDKITSTIFMGLHKGFCHIHYLCKWNSQKKSYQPKASILAFRSQDKRQGKACKSQWKATLVVEKKKTNVQGELVSKESKKWKENCLLNHKKAREGLLKTQQKPYYYCEK